MTRTLHLSLLVGVVLGASACDREALDVRTFPLAHIRPDEAQALILPYVYLDRPEAPGTTTVAAGAITVRETPDNLDKIARVLAEFDVPRPDVRLRFQLIEADGFTEHDPRIADVEEELRKIFQFGGYRLSGEALVFTADGAEFSQSLRAGAEDLSLEGTMVRSSEGTIRLQGLQLCCPGGGGLRTSVVVRPGQTVIVGSSPSEGQTATLLLTVRAEEVAPGAR